MATSNTRHIALRNRPDARIESVETLVRYTREGRVRVPRFQRPLRWGADDVVKLLDSVYQGLPIGSLLLWKRPAPAARISIGPLFIDAQEVPDAWWVVDGQQRLAALTASLTRPTPIPTTPQDAYAVYFDPVERSFHSPSKSGQVPETWVPLPHLLDSDRLAEFVVEWKFFSNREMRAVVFEAGKRIREFQVPVYIVDAEDESTLREIFYRTNEFGKRLTWQDVHDALFSDESTEPSTIDDLGRHLEQLGMGTLRPNELTTCLLAFRGLDVTRSLADHRLRDRDILRGAAAASLPAMRQALSFLKTTASIPHLRLLPHGFIVEVLARFFGLHPDAHERSRSLLARWVWRVLLAEGTYNDKTLRRAAVSAVTPDEEDSVQRLLQLVNAHNLEPFRPPDTFDARAAKSRLTLLALASCQPRSLEDGQQLDIAALIEREGIRAFPAVHAGSAPAERAAANRLIHPATRHASRLLLERIQQHGVDDVVVRSHAVSARAAVALGEGDARAFIAERAVSIENAMHVLAARFSHPPPSDNDRPSIEYLLLHSGGLE